MIPRWAVPVAILASAVGRVDAQEGGRVCPRCIVWSVRPAEAQALLDTGSPLAGLRLLVEGADPLPAARALAARGADSGARLAWTDEPADPLPAWLVLAVPDHADLDALAFRLKALTSDLRARRDDVRIGLEAGPATLADLAGRDVAAYVDFAIGPAPLLESWRRGRAPSSLAAAVAASRSGEPVLLGWPDGPAIPLAAATLASWLGDEAIDAPVPALRCAAVGRDVPCRARAFHDPEGEGRITWIEADAPVDAVSGWAEPPATVRALVPLAPEGVKATPADAGRVALDPPARSLVVRTPATGDDVRFTTGIEVSSARALTAAEILARHRAAEQRRRRLVARLIASGDTTITFTLPGLSAPATVTARTVLYDDGARREVEQQDLRWNGTLVPLDAGRVPRLPIVEPAAAEPPLALRLTEAYAYSLAGREDVAGRPAYVLAFASADGAVRGRAWMDAGDFGLARLETVRASLPGPIVSSEQEDTFARTDVGGRTAWLLVRSEIHQTYEGPGHRTPIHRLVRFVRLEPNPPDFQARRARAHAGSSVLMRETPDGFRYLAADPKTAGERRPAGRSDAVRTLALGLTVDPNVDGVLPFGGIGYLDLDLFGTGAQVNGFLGAGFVQGSFTVPRLGRSRWRLQGALFAVLVRYNDRSFHQGVEDYGETLRQRPSRATLGVSRPLTARSRVRVAYELDHNALGRSDLTSPDFVEPVPPLAHGLRVELEGRQGAWTAVAFASVARRTRWEPWGHASALEGGRARYERFGLSLSRSVVIAPRATGRFEASWQDGRHLDRFSRYAVDSFLNRLRGYPAGSLRYDRGLVLRGQASAGLRPGLRADLFLDAGFLRDPGYGDDLRAYPGLGVGLEQALPRGALLAAEAGFAFEGRDREGRRGTQSLQVTLVKTF